VLTAACGGGGGQATRASWIRSADAICASYGPKIAALGPMPVGRAAIARHLRANLALTQPELHAVEALPRPTGTDGAAIAATLAARERAVAALARAAAIAGRGGDPTAELQKAAGFVQDARTAAASLGLRVCGAPSAPTAVGTPS
jgi:hypothetical protein